MKVIYLFLGETTLYLFGSVERQAEAALAHTGRKYI